MTDPRPKGLNSRYPIRFNAEDVDDDGRVTVTFTGTVPFPASWESGTPLVLTARDSGDVYIGEVLDLNDSFRDGGDGSWLWVQLR